MELVYLGILADDERYELHPVDTLRHPFDLLEAISKCRDVQKRASIQYSVCSFEVFAFCGEETEIRGIETDTKAAVQRTIYRATTGKQPYVVPPCIGSQTANQFFELYLNALLEDQDLANSAHTQLKGEDGLHLLCFSYCQSPDDLGSLEEVICGVVGDWIENEDCSLLGKQVLTKPFLLNGLRGRHIIAPMFDSERRVWTLLTEGARIVPLSERKSSFAERYSEVWTDGYLAGAVLNPAYGFGISFDHWDLFEDWMFSLLYLILATSLEHEWSTAERVSLYDRFIDMLKNRLPYTECERYVSKEFVVETAAKMVAGLKEIVRGTDSYFERDYLQRMKYCQYHLCKLAPLLEEERPGCLSAASRPSVFERNRYCELLRLCSIGNSYSRGKALEDLAEYFFSAIPGWRLIDNRILSFNGEMDLAYCNTSLKLPHWDMGAVLLVECKNHSQPADISVLRNFYYLMQSKGSSAGAIVSMGGFTIVAREEAIRLALKDYVVLLIDGNDLMAVANSITPEEMINRKYYELMSEVENDERILGY